MESGKKEQIKEGSGSMVMWRGNVGMGSGAGDDEARVGGEKAYVGDGVGALRPVVGNWNGIAGEQGGKVVQSLVVAFPVCLPDKSGKELSPEEVSNKVLSQICKVSRLLGLTFEGHEQDTLRLFTD